MFYGDSTITVSTTVEEQAFSLPRAALRCQTNGLSAPVLRGYTNSRIAIGVVMKLLELYHRRPHAKSKSASFFRASPCTRMVSHSFMMVAPSDS